MVGVRIMTAKRPGRPPVAEHLRRIPYAIRLPRWLVERLSDPRCTLSQSVMIERALRDYFGWRPPEPSPPESPCAGSGRTSTAAV
jgi:hypothetical protein